MKERAFFWLGAVIGGIIAAAVLFSVFWVPRKGLGFGREPLHFTLVLDEAHGLRAGSPVAVSGVEAGEITALDIRELPQRGYKVLANVEVFDGERFGPMLKLDSAYQVAVTGILGEASVAIVPGGRGAPVAGQLVDGIPPGGMARVVEDLSRIAKRLADFIDGREPGDPNLRRALVDLQETVRNVRDFSEKLPR
jgi:ABC-type transporter Mla subunit MlaD